MATEFSFGIRHVQVILLFLLLTIGVGMRLQMAVAIVAMTEKSTSPNPHIATYDWKNKSVILSSFYWGYITIQIVAEALGRMYGTKKLLIGAMFFNSTASCLIPTIASKLGSYGVIGCRVFQGVSQGFFYPSIYNLLGRWAPVSERSRLGTIALGGYAFGSIVTNPLVGFMSATWWGWPSSFYLYGALGYAWIVLWIFFGSSSPADHKTIKSEERRYIETSLGSEKNVQINIPWKAILTSPRVWALAIVSCGLNWGNITLGTETPTYMNKVLNLDIKSNGVLASAPPLATFISNFSFAYTADYIINNKYLSRGTTRKTFTGIACGGSAVSLIVLSYLPHDSKALCVMMLVINGFFAGSVIGGSSVTQIDMSPRFAGVIMSVSNSFSNGVGLLAPLVVQAIVTHEVDQGQWRTIFFITAAMNLGTLIIFLIFGSAELQPFNSYGQTPDEEPADTPEARKISRKVSMVMNNL